MSDNTEALRLAQELQRTEATGIPLTVRGREIINELVAALAQQAVTPTGARPGNEGLTMGQIAYKGFDDYWTEDCRGLDAEAWEASAQAVRAALAQQAATPTGPEMLSAAVAEEIDELLGVIFQSARYERPSTDARPALEAFYRRHADLAEQAETLFGRMHARITELEAQIEQAATPAPAETFDEWRARFIEESDHMPTLRDAWFAALRAAPPATPAAQPAEGWIDVNDRLPEKETDVLAYVSDRRICVAGVFNGFWQSVDRPWRGMYVTHWRPLPAAPSTAQEAG